MANKTRKDKKGYALRTGECQRKDGRYSFSYTDRWKKRHTVYATSLVELRELEKQIRMDIDSGINPNMAKTMTLNDMFDLYISRKYDLNEKFEPAYCRFIVQADYNTRNGFIDYKRTRTVSEYLKNNPVSRKELMMQLESEETDVKALRETINILLKAGYLTVEGSPRGQNSILSLTEAFPY